MIVTIQLRIETKKRDEGKKNNKKTKTKNNLIQRVSKMLQVETRQRNVTISLTVYYLLVYMILQIPLLALICRLFRLICYCQPRGSRYV